MTDNSTIYIDNPSKMPEKVKIKSIKEPYVKDIDGSLESMQQIVGGTIQAIYPFE